MGSRLSIRARIALFGALVVAFAIALVGALVYALASYGGEADRDQALRDRAEDTVASLLTAPPDAFDPRRAPAPVNIADANDVFVTILAADGSPLVSTGEVEGTAPAYPPDLLAAAAGGSAKATVTLAAGVEARLHVAPWSRPDLGLSGYVVAGEPTRKLRTDLNAILVFLAVAAFISLVAAFAASWRVAGRALRPLRAMARTADEIGGAEDLSRRLPPIRPRDEIGRLTASFNGMLARLAEAHGRLAAALDREKRFVADASHELRTPLTSIRANADFLLDRPSALLADRHAAVADIAAESELMSRLVHDLLTLARADAGQRLEGSPVDVLPILEDVRRQAGRLHPAREVNVVVEPGLLPGATTVAGDGAALRQLVWILLDNALRHGGAPSGCPARTWLCLSAGDERLLLRVADDGGGIPDRDLERVFERFYQADPARRGGAGLGLAIARWIAAEHGGRIWARNNDGTGASFFVELPLAAQPSGV